MKKTMCKKIVSSIFIIISIFSMQVFAFAAPSTLEDLTPYVYLSSYEIVEGVAESGESFTLRAYITNANPLSSAYNLMTSVFFPGDDNFKFQEGEANQRYITHINGGETISLDFVFEVGENFVASEVVIDFTFNYSNEDGAEHVNSTLASIPQYQKTALEVLSLDFAGDVIAGQSTLVNLRCANTGETNLNDIEITLEGDFDGSPIQIENDSLSIDENFESEAFLLFNEIGDSEIKVNIEYKNERDDIFFIDEVSYEVEVLETSVENESDLGVSDNTSSSNILSSNQFWFYIMAASAGLVVIVIVTLIINIKLKQNKRK